jgi:RNA polymerase sigma-70 factor (ECF subfamily)
MMSTALTLSAAALVDQKTPGATTAGTLTGGGDGAAAPPEEWDIERLTAGVRAGEEAAVRALHARYAQRLTRYALVVTRGDETAADEAVQSAFLRALRHLRPVTDDAALWAWLARATRSAASDAGRRSRRYLRLLGRAGAFLRRGEVAIGEPIEDTDAIWAAALESALDALDAEARSLVDSRYFHHRSLAEIAAEQSTSERAIEGRLARLREKLRRSVLRQLASTRHEP